MGEDGSLLHGSFPKRWELFSALGSPMATRGQIAVGVVRGWLLGSIQARCKRVL